MRIKISIFSVISPILCIRRKPVVRRMRIFRANQHRVHLVCNFHNFSIGFRNFFDFFFFLSDDRPFFADNEIEQYLMNKRLQHFPNTTVSGGTKEDEDSLQLWRKLNCLASEVQPIHKSEVLDNDEPLDLSMKPAKSVLAILDFTMPSLSSSAPSSPGQGRYFFQIFLPLCSLNFGGKFLTSPPLPLYSKISRYFDP